MPLRVLIVTLTLLTATPNPSVLSASDQLVDGYEQTVAQGGEVPPDRTFNEFLPEERGLGECISSLPRPGCGSEARGGWRQWIVLGTIVAGLGIIGWRVRTGMKKSQQSSSEETR